MTRYVSISSLMVVTPIPESEIDSKLWHHTWKYGYIIILKIEDGKWYEAWNIDNNKFKWREVKV